MFKTSKKVTTPTLLAFCCSLAVLPLLTPNLYAAESPAPTNNKEGEAAKPDPKPAEKGPKKEYVMKDGNKVFYLTPPLYTFYYGGGINMVGRQKGNDVGAIALLRFKRTTNFTFYDLQIQSYIVPSATNAAADDSDPLDYYGLIRLKKSQKFFDWPSVYEWSIYSVKTSTVENVTRAIIETGYGSFLWKAGRGSKKIQLNAEAGVTFDYASLDAYSANLASGFAKSAAELDFDYKPLSGKGLLYFYYEIINPDPKKFANQTRMDVELNLSYHFSPTVYTSLGTIFTQYLDLEEKFLNDSPLLVERAVTVFLVATYKHKFTM